MIYVGTSGYSYQDWIGAVYPPGTASGDMLRLYAERFRTVELNFTYYRMPTVRTTEGIVRRLPPGFQLFAKANEATTHRCDREAAGPFKEGLAPARDAGVLAGILAQFPFSFPNVRESRDYLSRLAEDFAGWNLVVEFRNAKWSKMSTLALLRELGLGFCCVDEPQGMGLMPPVAQATTRTAYVRFHSRDRSKWYESGGKERYNYLYSREEMAEWVPRVRSLADVTDAVYVFFNNCHAGHAAVNATEFREMLREMGLVAS